MHLVIGLAVLLLVIIAVNALRGKGMIGAGLARFFTLVAVVAAAILIVQYFRMPH